MKISISFPFLLALCRVTLLAQSDSTVNAIEFNRDIRPILSDKCYTCHGPNSSHRLAGLRFDVEEGAKKDLGGGRYAIVPGDSARSEIIRRITATDPSKRMPFGNAPLSDREIGLVRLWIQQGAKWEKMWSLVPPKRPELPNVKDRSWPRNPVDYFVLNRLEREGLAPSPEADRATLIRRVTLDLTGLPPTPEEVDAFLVDRSSGAYENVVDRLLQSPRYGERMANPWLDAARYADTNGYQGDGEREMWRWRDWVIDAFNRNMPFSEFTIEQIAGDMLPNVTLDQRIASGFNRNHRGNAEGGIIPEEYAVEYVVDRVDTTAAVWMGLTVGCARCHDHKYDPISQKEFYQLFAYFNNVPESGKARKQGNSAPFIKAPTPEQLAQLKQLDSQVAAATDKFAKLEPELMRAQREWEKSLEKSRSVQWAPSEALAAYFPLDDSLTAQILPAKGSTESKKAYKKTAYEESDTPPPKGSKGEDRESDVSRAPVWKGEAQFGPGRIGQAASFDGRNFVEVGDIVNFGYLDKFTLAAWVYPTEGTGAIITREEDQTEPRGIGVALQDGKVEVNMAARWLDDGVRVETEKSLRLREWHHVMMTYSGSRDADGVKIYVDGEEQKCKVLVDDMNSPFNVRQPWRIGGGGGTENRFHGSIDDVRVYSKALSLADADVLSSATSVPEIAGLAPEKRSKAQADKIQGYFLENAAPANIEQAWRQSVEIVRRRENFYESVPTVMVMEEMAKPRETHVLIRGAYDHPGERLSPGVPAILPQIPKNLPDNRLGFAQWLVDPENPLTARVTVNRFWQMYFGTGLVKTVEDFGAQGDPPSNQELLDWLATEFVRTGWDVKAMQKTVVMSATYRQSSDATPEMIQRDPENRLLARGPRFRLPAEMVRDQALAVAGLLVEKLGGPSVKPYQPAGLWEALSGQKYPQDHGDKLYRRSFYTFWKRTNPPPAMSIFDASSRETCVVLDNLTNTPLQALDLMNDVTYLEVARVLAQRMMKEGGGAPPDRIAFAFRLATARRPSAAESGILLDSFNYQLDKFKSKQEAAAKYLSEGEYPLDKHLDTTELAAYTVVANLILNLDETVTKE